MILSENVEGDKYDQECKVFFLKIRIIEETIILHAKRFRL